MKNRRILFIYLYRKNNWARKTTRLTSARKTNLNKSFTSIVYRKQSKKFSKRIIIKNKKKNKINKVMRIPTSKKMTRHLILIRMRK